jgi:hypothetical protein
LSIIPRTETPLFSAVIRACKISLWPLKPYIAKSILEFELEIKFNKLLQISSEHFSFGPFLSMGEFVMKLNDSAAKVLKGEKTINKKSKMDRIKGVFFI